MYVAIIQKIINIIRGKEFQKAKERKQAFENAGNSAKIVKKNVDWDANGAKYGYIKNEDMITK